MLRMTVIGATGRPAFVIGDNTLSRGPGSKAINTLTPSMDALVQTVATHRSQSVVNVARDEDTYNESTTLNPEVAYGFETEDEKARFLMDLQRQVPPVATVEIQVGQTKWYLVNAKLRPISVVEEYEVAVTLRWTISGGKLLGALPDAS